MGAWRRYARDSGLAPLHRFTRNLRKYPRGIFVSARFHRIKVINRMAYGFRDSTYLFLKIKAAFLGKTRSSKNGGPEEPIDNALRCSPGGLNTKIHLTL